MIGNIVAVLCCVIAMGAAVVVVRMEMHGSDRADKTDSNDEK